jgi:hypothetical protein
VQSALVSGSVFRVLPLAVGALFLLFQHRQRISGFFRRISNIITRIPLFFRKVWKRFRSKPGDSDEGLRATHRRNDFRATGDGSLLLGNFPVRKPRLSELADSFIAPRPGRESNDVFEGSLAEFQESGKASLL